MKSVRVQLTGASPEAVEYVRQLIVGQLNQKHERVTSDDKTKKSTKDKYKGNGIAYMTVIVTEEELEVFDAKL